MLRTILPPLKHSKRENKIFLTKAQNRFFSSPVQNLKNTPLYNFHLENGAKMINFGGWNLPVMYKSDGILASHLHTRSQASLFDVSHMGQLRIFGKDRIEFIETLVPGDIKGLKDGQMRLTVLTNEKGGIVDDTIITKNTDFLGMVINGACREKDIQHIQFYLESFKANGKIVGMELLSNLALIALQGPRAVNVLKDLVPQDFNVESMPFMTSVTTEIDSIKNCTISRCGYTGEDGFEISAPDQAISQISKKLLNSPFVKLAGLGARDSLRLEAGYCLYGHDLDDSTTPIEAGLAWTIGKRRRLEGGFLGEDVILNQIKNGTERKRFGCILEGKMPPNEGASVFSINEEKVGKITSAVYSPSLQQAIAMGYISTPLSKVGNQLLIDVRGKFRNAKISKMPMVPMGMK